MLFIHPMWDNESQRIGMQKCWPAAYNIHTIGELIGFSGLIVLLYMFGYMIYLGVTGRFTWGMLLLLGIPIGIGVISEVMVQVSWKMVARRGFEYDYENRESSWIKGGKRIKYNYTRQGNASDASDAVDF